MITNSISWWDELADRSHNIRSMKHPKNKSLNDLASKLGNCAQHNNNIARWSDGLIDMGGCVNDVQDLLVNLVGNNTYGAFSELAGYGKLLDAHIPFRIQESVGNNEILNPNGSILDGIFTIGDDVFFDIKSFGLQEHLVSEIRRKLRLDFPKYSASIDYGPEVSVSDLQYLLGTGYDDLVNQLNSVSSAIRGDVRVKIHNKMIGHVVISESEHNPYALAEKYSKYVFNYSKQFTRNKPFVLIFVIHPWLGSSMLYQDFQGHSKDFFRSFARRSFMQHIRSNEMLWDLRKGIVSQYLSGIMVLDVSLEKECKIPVNAFYENPHAINPISELTKDFLVRSIDFKYCDDFLYDVY